MFGALRVNIRPTVSATFCIDIVFLNLSIAESLAQLQAAVNKQEIEMARLKVGISYLNLLSRQMKMEVRVLTLLHSERPKLYGALAILCAIGLRVSQHL